MVANDCFLNADLADGTDIHGEKAQKVIIERLSTFEFLPINFQVCHARADGHPELACFLDSRLRGNDIRTYSE
jgi:hypothetical protein